jgi:hypothetical protein
LVDASPPADSVRYLQDCIAIEVKHDDFPKETGWTRRLSTEGAAVSETAYITEGAYTFQTTGTYGGGVCCQYSAGGFKITLCDEPVAIRRVSLRRSESIDVVGRTTGPAIDNRLDVAYPYGTS